MRKHTEFDDELINELFEIFRKERYIITWTYSSAVNGVREFEFTTVEKKK